jgi:uncharacterized protein (TIGR02231 family)
LGEPPRQEQRPLGLSRERPAPSREAADANNETLAEQASLELSGTSPIVSYPIAKPIAVPSNNQPHRAVIAAFELEAELDYVTVPRLAEQVCLRARVINTSGYVLLAGPASIFCGGDFVGKAPLKLTAVGEPAVFLMGADSRVAVQRELTERSASTTVIGNIRRTLFAYKITLTNQLPTTTRVTVTDQLPVSRHEDIFVRLKESQPKPTEQTEQNVLRWTLELGPYETQELNLSFTIDHPREMRITGIL